MRYSAWIVSASVLALVVAGCGGSKEDDKAGESAAAGGDKAGGDKAGGDKAGGDKAGGDKAGGDKAGGDKAGGDKAGGDKAGMPKALDEEKRKKLAAIPVLDQKEIRKVVDAWLAAQNEGKLDDYKKLYSKSFSGVLKVGKREKKLDLEGWYKSRAKMFKMGKMKVTAESLDIKATPKDATVQFVQTFELGRFKDVGPKRIIVAKEEDGLRITSEVMLESRVSISMKTYRDGFKPVEKLSDADKKSVEDGLDDSWIAERYRTFSLGKGGPEAMLVVYQTDPEKAEETEYGPPELSATVALMIKDGDDWAIESSAETQGGYGTEPKFFTERDIDGDKVDDLILVYRGGGFHEAWNGIIFVLSGNKKVLDIVYSSGGGEGGYHTSMEPMYACYAIFDKRLAFITTIKQVDTEYDFEADKEDETVDYYVRAWIEKGDEMDLTELYGYEIASGKSAKRLYSKWKKAAKSKVDPVASFETEWSEVLIDVPRCYGGDNVAIIAPGDSVDGMSGKFALVGGVSTDEHERQAARGKYAKKSRMVTIKSKAY